MATDEASPYEATPTSAFGDLARRLVGYHPPVDDEVAQRLGEIRNAYKDMIARIEFLLPDATPETTLAARAIHDANQRCIAAVILNQTESKDIVRAVNGVKINDPNTPTDGTALRGHIDIDYATLVGCFGTPTGGDGYKVDAEWILEWPDGAVATVYNYKTGLNYGDPDGLPVEDIRDWHIGGHVANLGGPETSVNAHVITRVKELILSMEQKKEENP